MKFPLFAKIEGRGKFDCACYVRVCVSRAQIAFAAAAARHCSEAARSKRAQSSRPQSVSQSASCLRPTTARVENSLFGLIHKSKASVRQPSLKHKHTLYLDRISKHKSQKYAPTAYCYLWPKWLGKEHTT